MPTIKIKATGEVVEAEEWHGKYYYDKDSFTYIYREEEIEIIK